MNRAEFDSLPVNIRVRILTQVVFDGKQLADIKPEKKPLPPKRDDRISRQGGYQWASESSLESLRFWCARATEGAANGGQWAEKDKQRAKSLSYWILWREWEPYAVWSGERFGKATIAAPPSDKPLVYQYDGPPRSRSNGSASSETSPPAGSDDDDLAFA